MAQRLPLKVKDTKGLATVLLQAIEGEPTAEMGVYRVYSIWHPLRELHTNRNDNRALFAPEQGAKSISG